MHYGRLVDVYGLKATSSGVTIDLYQADVVVGLDIKDERDASSTKGDAEITYDYISSNPSNLQPRLLITRTIGSADFQAAFAALDDSLRLVTPGVFGQDIQTQPYSIVPRNAALVLTFTHDLGVTDDFFVQRDASGAISGLKNTEAVQLLRIVGDPTDNNPTGDFVVIPARVVPRKNQLILDPVLLGIEGLQYQTRNSAAGLSESPDQSGANIRIALALDGPLAIQGLRPDQIGSLNGKNNSGVDAIIRDFRSGNRADTTPDISQGFVRDPIPPRLVGEIVTYVESVDDLDSLTQVLTLYKNGVEHELDRGDAIEVFIDNSGVPVAVTEITTDPNDDLGMPETQHVRAIVRRVINTLPDGSTVDVLEQNDPSNRPGYPSNPQQREAWLVANAPKAIVVAEFTAERRDATTGNTYGDDPRYFVTFTPSPLPFQDGTPSQPNENVSPYAGAIMRFTKPMDLNTVKPYDTYFFGTRDLLDPSQTLAFQTTQRIDQQSFIYDKYVTPHLVGAKVFDEDGSQTSLRLQPTMGFYLDDAIRSADEGKPFEEKSYKYYLHLLGGSSGMKDLSGNAVDFQLLTSISDFQVIPFSLDTRSNGGQPSAPDNLAVSVVRRFKNIDEDEQPSYYIQAEVQESGKPTNGLAYNLQDVFGAVVYLSDGSVTARPTARVRQVVDNLNQQAAPPQTIASQPNPLRFCPADVGGETQVAAPSAGVAFGSPVQNPLNPFGARLQTLWREIDMSLSRTDPLDFNLDVEQMFWAPFAANPVTYDEFDQIRLYLGHSEYRPEPCVGSFSALPTLPSSGLFPLFADNFAYNPNTLGGRDPQTRPHEAFIDQPLTILSSLTVTEVNGVNRFLPLPAFKQPYFVWRDERSKDQGGDSGLGSDQSSGGGFLSYIISPFLAGGERYVRGTGTVSFNPGYWDNRRNYNLVATARPDAFTGGLLGSIALPLLADFWVYPDSPSLPDGNPFRASGSNGWQISLSAQSAAQPNFRVYSAGGLVQSKPKTVSPSDTTEWNSAIGGYTPTGGRTRCCDNSVYWIMADYVKRISVLTAGFVDILDPHRVPSGGDPRLGPYLGLAMPSNVLPKYSFDFDPPLQALPSGTKVTAEFRGAGPVDPNAWAGVANSFPGPDEISFPLDPLKAGDAHIRKYDDRAVGGQPRATWTYYYNRNVTDYTSDPNTLTDPNFTNKFAGPNESFLPQNVRYFNWRFVFENNVAANPPLAPRIDSFAVTYRLEQN